MSAFTEAEQQYLKGQRIGRLATLSASGELHVVPLRFLYNEEDDVIDLIGKGLGTSKKYRDAAATRRAAFVVDDFGQPAGIRGVEIRGRAEVHPEGGDAYSPGADPQFIRLHPEYIVSWGIESAPDNPNGRRVR